jgi:hypothetical protein
VGKEKRVHIRCRGVNRVFRIIILFMQDRNSEVQRFIMRLILFIVAYNLCSWPAKGNYHFDYEINAILYSICCINITVTMQLCQNVTYFVFWASIYLSINYSDLNLLNINQMHPLYLLSIQ